MFNHHHHRIHLINFTLTKKLSELYVFIILRSLAISMIGIFIPIYMIKELGYPLFEVLFFYVFLFIFFGLTLPLTAKLSSKIGFKHVMLISLFPQLLFFYLLNQLNVFKLPLVLLALIAGLTEGLFWLSFHLNFAYSTDRKHRGEEVGLWYILATIIGVIGPFFGGLILTLYNFHVLFFIVASLLLISIIPLLMSKDIYKTSPMKWHKILDYSTGKEAISFIAYGIRLTGAGIFWPIFIFFSLSGYLSTGFIISFSSFTMIFFIWLIARLSDRINKDIIIKIGSLFEGIIWLVKLVVKSFGQILSISILGGIAYTMIDIPFSARVYDKVRKHKPVEFLIFRELFLIIGRLICLSLVIFTISKFDFMTSIKTSFIISSIGSFIQMLI